MGRAKKLEKAAAENESMLRRFPVSTGNGGLSPVYAQRLRDEAATYRTEAARVRDADNEMRNR